MTSFAIVSPVLLAAIVLAPAQCAPCDRAALEKIVADASTALIAVNQDNTKLFQDKLRDLRQAKGWTDGEYVTKATPYVSDDVTKALDAASLGLLDKVKTLNGASEGADCALVTRELQSAMDGVIAINKQKWQHLIAKAKLAIESPK